MNRFKLPENWDWPSIRVEVATRIREVRFELYGEHGGPLLASALHLPFHRWSDYEHGTAIPGEVLLRFLALTRVEPHWLLTGQGPKYAVSV
ncbi:hypothetical protein [Tautonia marina]|uniref:hypothetical protein n=1 Tax=Tautonia marina TaxID=2653855 RepID=UPI0012609ACB|nr:hypothetical protein [Tautonia marina]